MSDHTYLESMWKEIIIFFEIIMGVLTWVVVTVLGVIGFAATGPVGGSLAAWAQATFYGGAVTAGSWFAAAQSVAMAAPTP